MRQLKPDARDGRYHYTAYLLPSHPMPGVRYGESNLARPRYDLAAKPGDICLRLFAPGYNLIKSRSGVVIVPASRIAAALKTAPASR